MQRFITIIIPVQSSWYQSGYKETRQSKREKRLHSFRFQGHHKSLRTHNLPLLLHPLEEQKQEPEHIKRPSYTSGINKATVDRCRHLRLAERFESFWIRISQSQQLPSIQADLS